MATWAVLSGTCGPGKLMWLEEGDQAEIGGQAEIGDQRGCAIVVQMVVVSHAVEPGTRGDSR